MGYKRRRPLVRKIIMATVPKAEPVVRRIFLVNAFPTAEARKSICVKCICKCFVQRAEEL